MAPRPRRKARVLLAIGAALVLRATACAPPRAEDPPEPVVAPEPAPGELHAVLLNGGGRPQINYHSHLDHLRRMLAVLDATGVDPARIAVFSGDGSDPAADLAAREGELPPDFWLLPKAQARRLRPPIEYVDSTIAGFVLRPATHDALRAWFEADGRALGAGDTLLFYVTDHGERNTEDPDDNSIVLWGEELSVAELRKLLERLDPDVRVVMLMSQCYSGGFANAIYAGDELSNPANVCGYFSASADRKAHGCYAEVSGKPAVGHSHRIFEALAAVQRLPDAHREVLVSDDTPDVPQTTTGFFLEKELERAAQRGGRETPQLIDILLAQALRDPAAWEPQIRLLDRVGHAFGFSSPRSLAALDAQARDLSELRERLDTYGDRWERSLDDLRRENLAAFQAAHPEWRERLAPAALEALDASTRRLEVYDLLGALVRFTEQDRDRAARLRDLHWKSQEAKAARYRSDVRLAAVLRMRALLIEVAGRHYLARHAPEGERRAFARLETCEELALAGAPDVAARAPEPFPTLAEDRRRLESVVPGWLGMRYRQPGAAERGRYELLSGAASVTAVFADSPAEEAGLQVSDIVLGPPGEPFGERHAVREWAVQGEIGRPLPLQVLRDGREIEVTVRLRPYPLELPAQPGPPPIGSAAPRLALDYLPDARPPEPWRSRLLFFWATWCRACKEAIPEVLAFAEARDVGVVAISDEDPGDVEAFLLDYAEPFPESVATDRQRANFQSYGVSGTPTFVLVDAGGSVRHYQTGYDRKRGLGVDGWSWDAPSAGE